ncbi:hypothetical protein KPHVMX_550022 [Klebsiella pneumoniae]|nr:hypothetical protein KPHVMX_550022 [Klebsiella pneumoniae]
MPPVDLSSRRSDLRWPLSAAGEQIPSIELSCCLSQGLIDANEISQYAVVNQYGAAVPAEAKLLPAVADAFDNVTAHAAS